MEVSGVLFTFSLTLFAGLSTGIESIMVFVYKEINPKFLCASLGFSAGVMIYVSMVEIFAKARDALSADLGVTQGYWYTVIAFLLVWR